MTNRLCDKISRRFIMLIHLICVMITFSQVFADAKTPPPRWVFVNDISDADKTILRKEMEACRNYFTNRYKVEATDFTVLVGNDVARLAAAHQRISGVDYTINLPGSALSGVQFYASRSVNEYYIFIMNFENREFHSFKKDMFSRVKTGIVHEYFHILQGRLSSDLKRLPNGDIVYDLMKGPIWLTEGTAQWAELLYQTSQLKQQHAILRRQRKNTWEYNAHFSLVAHMIEKGVRTLSDLPKLENRKNMQGEFVEFNYSMAFLATRLLIEQSKDKASYVRFWQQISHHSTWQQAFEVAFGISIENFYDVFEEWLFARIILDSWARDGTLGPTYLNFWKSNTKVMK